MATTRTYELGGGKYTAVQNDDGSNTWNILDVPICGEVPKGAKLNAKDIDKAWLERAVEKHQARLKQDNFKPPLHLEHHEPGVKTERAGEFIPHRVGRLQYNGKPTYVVFADLTRIPDGIFQRIERGELPYLSVELGRWEDGEFTSLALMDDDAPFFRFPNLTIGDKVFALEAAAEKLPLEGANFRHDTSAIAFAETKSGGTLVLCKSFSGVKLDDEKKDEAAEGDKADESAKDEKPKDEAEKPEASADPMTLLLQAITRMEKTLTILAQQQSGVGALPADKDDKAQTPVEQEKDMSDEKKDEKQVAKSDADVKLAAMDGKVSALEAKLATREKADEVKDRISKAEASLKGWHLSEDIKKKIALYAGETNPKLLDAFVDSVKLNFPKDPPTTLAAFELSGSVSANPETEKVLAKYQAQGPEVIEMSRKFAAQHAEAKKAGMTSLSLESFVAAQFRGLEAQAQVNGAAL